MKLTFRQRFFTHLTFFTLFFSGIVWLILEFKNPEIFRDIMVYSLRLHGAASFGFLIVFGMVLSTHISFNWQVKKNRRISGIILTIFVTILILSGYLLYYLGGEEIRAFTSYLHWISGISCSAVFAVHFFKKSKKTGIKKPKNKRAFTY
jgi:hypothetical protein